MAKKTDREILVKGIKYLGITLLLMFLGPTLLYFVMGKNEHFSYYPLLIIGFLICGGAIYYGFKGIKTIVSSMFDSTIDSKQD